MDLIRNEFGDIDIKKTLEKIELNLIEMKKSEVSSLDIIDSINNILNTYPDIVFPKKSLIVKVCNQINYDIKDCNKTIQKINTVIDYLVSSNKIKFIKGRNGGITK